MSIHLRSSRGSAATEYVALLLVVAVVVGTALSAYVRQEPAIIASTSRLVCEALQQPDCEPAPDAVATGELLAAPIQRQGTVPAAALRQTTADAPGAPVARRVLLQADDPPPPPAPPTVSASLGDPVTLPDGTESQLDWCGPGNLVDHGDGTESEYAVCADAVGDVRDCSRGRFSYFGLVWSSWGERRCHAGGLPAEGAVCQGAPVPGTPSPVLCRLPGADDRYVRCTGAEFAGTTTVRWECEDPDHDADLRSTPYPGDASCGVAQDEGWWAGRWQRACVGGDGTVYHCTAPHGWFGGGQPEDSAWSCDSRTVSPDLLPSGACAGLEPESALCEVAGQLVRCFQPAAGDTPGALVHCRTLAPDDPLAVAAADDEPEPGLGLVSDDCGESMELTPELLESLGTRHGPVPADGLALEAAISAEEAHVATLMQQMTGYDVTDPTQRAELSGAMDDLELALDTQQTPGSWAQADAFMDSVSGDGAPDALANQGRRLAGTCAIVGKAIFFGAATGIAVNSFVISRSDSTDVGMVTGPVGLGSALLVSAGTIYFELRDAREAAADRATMLRTIQALSQAMSVAVAGQQEAMAAQRQQLVDQQTAAMEMGMAIDQMQANAAQHSTWWQTATDAIRWVWRPHRD